MLFDKRATCHIAKMMMDEKLLSVLARGITTGNSKKVHCQSVKSKPTSSVNDNSSINMDNIGTYKQIQ